MRLGLQSRIVLFFGALLAAVIGAALLLVDAANERNARATVQQELRVGERVFARLIDQNSVRLMQAAEILSRDFAFRNAVATRDLATIQSVLANHGARIGADEVALVSLDKAVVADILAPRRSGRPFAFPALVDAAERDGSSTAVGIVDGRAYEMAVVPVLAPTPIAWALFGFVVDDRLARDLRSLSGLDVSFVSVPSAGEALLLASTFGPRRAAALREVLAERPGAPADGTAALGGTEYVLRVLPVKSAGRQTVYAVLARSLDDALGPFRRLSALLFFLAIGSLAASVLGSLLIARSITRPIAQLSELTQRVEEGDYTQAVPVGGPREVSELARRFNFMREGIAAREREVLKLAYRDTLTDLPNRTLLNDRLRMAIETARRSGGRLALRVRDLDRFKTINDTLGHHAGDQVLIEVARRLGAIVRASDTVARLGGDEFCVLLVQAALPDAKRIAGKILADLERPISLGGHAIDVGASVGVVGFPEHGENAETLLRHADAAMYSAKRSNAGMAVYDADSHEQREEQLSLLSELRRAIEQDELFLVYQPKVDLAGGALVGAEALLRWRHPQKGVIPPDRFIPFAEQTGFIRKLTGWALDAAVEQAAIWHRRGQPLRVSVNLSVHDVLDPELNAMLLGRLRVHGLPPHLLCVEITESGVMRDAARAIEVLNALEKIGVGRSIDDFGTGYSSLAYVKQLSVDELKIDRSFVRNLVADPKDRAIVLTAIELAHNLGMSVVAEGVEERAAADLLRQLGCDAFQGYLVSKPLELGAFESWRRSYAAVAAE